MRWEESAIAGLIIQATAEFRQATKTRHRAGGRWHAAAGSRAAFELPDVSFLARGKLSRKTHRNQRVPSLAADLAVEVISRKQHQGRDRPEDGRILRRRHAIWHGSWTRRRRPSASIPLPRNGSCWRLGDVLDGGDVLPGFRLPCRTSSTWTMTEVPAPSGTPAQLSPRRPMAQLTLFRRRPSSAGGAAGTSTPRPGRSGDLLRHELLEIRGLAGIDLHAGSLHRPGQVLAAEVRGRLPGRVRRGLPRGLRRLQLLPVPHAGLLARALRRARPFAPVRVQGPRGDHRRNLAGPCPLRPPGRTGQRIVPRCPRVRR